MKTLILVLSTLVLSATAFATDGSTTIENSDLSPETQVLVASAVQSNCGFMKDLVQTAPTIQRADYQDTGDLYLEIQLAGSKKLDQYIYEDYSIVVEAVVPFVNGNGPVHAQVNRVRCEMK